jgi:iron(III) transport system substrate-binding protein
MKSPLRLSIQAAAGCFFLIASVVPINSIVLAAEQSPALQALIAAADKEGKLELQWGANQLGGNDGLKEITSGMNALFGTHIVSSMTPAPNENEALNAVMIAKNVNHPSPTDIFIGSNQHGALIYQRKIGLKVDWQELLPNRIQASSIEADGAMLRMYTVIPGGIIYNPQRAPYPPVNLTDLLKPEWKGRIASTPYASGFDLLSATDVWGKERTLDFARKLSTQLAGLVRCNDFERISSGEYIAYALDCTGTDAQTWEDKGAPIRHVIPADFPALRYYYMTVPTNAANPNAAKLLIVYLHTPEGQKLVWKMRHADLDTYADGQMAKEINAYEAKGLVFHKFTIAWYLEHPEIRPVAGEAAKIISRSN